MPIGRGDRKIFGGDTSCYLVQAGTDSIFLDAGSGMIAAPAELPGKPCILLSHLHLDHLIGLGMYPRFSEKGKQTAIYLPAESAEQAHKLLNEIYAPPWWPLTLENYTGDLEIDRLHFPMQLGKIRVDGIPGNHPGGSMIFRLVCGDRMLVYATDFEHGPESTERLRCFARGASLLLYDGQYTPEEYEKKKGFGHSTAEEGIALKDSCGAEKLLLIHHSPTASDDRLQAREDRIGRSDVLFAREGETVLI